MSKIAYNYEIIRKDLAAKVMEVVYTSPGRNPVHVSARLPYVGESELAVIQMFAPVPRWLEQDMEVQDVEVGKTGAVVPPDVKPTTLGTAKQSKAAAIAAWRYALEVSGITVGGSMVRTDRESQAQLTGAYQTLKGGLVDSIDWKTATGTFVTLTLTDVTALAQAVAQHVQYCFTQEKNLLSRVAAAQTIEDVNAISLPALPWENLLVSVA